MLVATVLDWRPQTTDHMDCLGHHLMARALPPQEDPHSLASPEGWREMQTPRSHHFMGNQWGNSGNSVRLYFGGSKITADGDCSHEIKRHLLLGRKVMTNLDSIFKSRDITLPTKVPLVKAMVFPVVMYRSES